MRKLVLISMLLFSVCMANAQENKLQEMDKKALDKFLADEKNQPQNVDECFLLLNNIIVDSTRASFVEKEEGNFVNSAYSSLGLWIKYYWCGKEESPLSKFFISKGVLHPDDMAYITLRSYHRHLTKKDIKLDEQTQKAWLFWQISSFPERVSFPKEISANTTFYKSIFYSKQPDGTVDSATHLASDMDKNEYWIYDYWLGWKKTETATIDQLEKCTLENRYEIVKTIYNISEND